MLHPIQILINYWETRPSAIGAKLDDLLRQGISHVSTFVPWQAAESDISHTLPRFLQAVADRRMTAALIVTPEVGVHYPNSGLPRDLVAKKENQSKHQQGGGVVAALPPNAFPLPSLFAPDFTKRYYSFLSRLDNLLADIEKTRGPSNPLKGVTVVLTGSYWKYYRSPRLSARSLYGGPAGDYCSNATLVYRQCLEEYFSRREFMDPTPMSATRWKSAAMDEVNRRWFYQQSEDVFRARTAQLIRRKTVHIPVREIELHTPEADPGFLYTSFLETMSGGHSDFRRLSAMLDETASRSSHGALGPTGPFVHWTSLGGFRTLCDSEKQFLLLKSLLLTAGRGGGILIDEREWFSLSAAFRARTEAFAKSATHGDFQLRNRALFLTPHLWSAPVNVPAPGATPATISQNSGQPGSGQQLWDEVQRKVGPRARIVSSLDLVLRERDSNLVFVDPSFVFTREAVQKLAGWARSNRVVVIPRSTLYTEAARRELEAICAASKSLEIDLGMPYRLHAMGEGKLIVYDVPENAAFPVGADAGRSREAGALRQPDARSGWQTFVAAILSLAEVQSYCRLSDDRLMVIPVRRPSNELGLFIMNPTRRALSADVIFPSEVEVSDLAFTIAGGSPVPAETDFRPTAASRFTLDVPPCGILPLGIKGLDFTIEERMDAQSASAAPTTGGRPRPGAEPAPEGSGVSLSELPGFDPEEGMDRVWS